MDSDPIDFETAPSEQLRHVYNFEVDGFHTYYVGDAGVWVHNTDCAMDVRKVDGAGRVGANTVEPLTVRLTTREEFRATSRNSSPSTIYEFDGMQYVTDDLARGISSRGQLRLNAGGNRFYDDRLIGHQGIADDIAFHAGADEFGFQGGALNLSPGNKSLNIKEYRSLERELKGYLQQGSTVESDFRRVFNPGNTTVRPDKYVVKYRVDGGDWRSRTFFNRDGG